MVAEHRSSQLFSFAAAQITVPKLRVQAKGETRRSNNTVMGTCASLCRANPNSSSAFLPGCSPTKLHRCGRWRQGVPTIDFFLTSDCGTRAQESVRADALPKVQWYTCCIRTVHDNCSLCSYAQTLSSVLSFLRWNAPQASVADRHSSIHSDIITRRLYQQPCRDSTSLAWARYYRYGSVLPTAGVDAPCALTIMCVVCCHVVLYFQ